MNIKTLIKSLPLQTNPKKYEQFVRELDYKKMLAEDPVEIRDKYYLENENLVETDLAHTSATYELHNKLNEKYNLSENLKNLFMFLRFPIININLRITRLTDVFVHFSFVYLKEFRLTERIGPSHNNLSISYLVPFGPCLLHILELENVY